MSSACQRTARSADKVRGPKTSVSWCFVGSRCSWWQAEAHTIGCRTRRSGAMTRFLLTAVVTAARMSPCASESSPLSPALFFARRQSHGEPDHSKADGSVAGDADRLGLATGAPSTRRMHPTSAAVMSSLGRDYADVSPLKGVYSGAPSSTPNVEAQLTRQA